MWQEARKVEDQIRNLAKFRWCTACPTSHHNTGNIIAVQTDKPGKKKSWPGWTTQIIVATYKCKEETDINQPCSIKWYNKATVFQPGHNQGYAHAHVHAQEERDTLPININKGIIAQRAKRPDLPNNINHFWCMVDKKSKIIYIIQAEVWPKGPIFIQDVNLENRRDRNVIIVDKSELKLEEQFPVCTECGVIYVGSQGEQTPEEIAKALSDRLLHNCRK